MLLCVAALLTFGAGFTEMETVAVFEHPLTSVPVTVYVVFAVGLTVTEAPLKLPGIQLYVLAPDAVSVAGEPWQIIPLDAVAVRTIGGATFTNTVSVAVQIPFDTVTT
jgi:hypothetical protein